MKAVENTLGLFGAPVLTKGRIYFAFAVALLTDALQIGLGPLGWAFIDEGLDIIAMLLICGSIGFHMLLLPTFLIEFIPGPDMLPTWTGCTAAVVILRKRNRTASASAPPSIEVESEVTPAEPSSPPPPRIQENQ
jgi:hypothetical protein